MSFSKVYEKLMYNSLVSHFDKYNILHQNQFGFRQGHSSHHALITLVNKITQSLDSGDMVIGIFLYLKKAFDTVNHNILVKKLYLYGIKGQLINWFKSYLDNRSQYVTYNEKRLDKFKLLLHDLDYTFPIIGLTKTWLKPHNVDCFFYKGIFSRIQYKTNENRRRRFPLHS